MFQIRKLTVRGFRGFAGEKEFVFDKPATILFGPNHCGKSSTLNAIEWSLFGDDAVGVSTKIRERVGWKVNNENLDSVDVRAEVELVHGDDVFTILRTLRQEKGRNVKQLEITLPDGAKLSGDQAQDKIFQLTGSSFRDFMTTAYLHQENVRAILTEEPRVRNDAIDRLLGLSQYNNLSTGIKQANCEKVQKSLIGEYEKFEAKVETALKTRRSDLEEARQKAIDAGLSDEQLSNVGVVELCAAARNSLSAFTENIGVDSDPPAAPGEWTVAGEFADSLTVEITRLRSVLPGIDEQTKLFGRKEKIPKLRVPYESDQKDLKTATDALAELNKETGGAEALRQAIADLATKLDEKQAALNAAHERAELVSAGIDYLETADAASLGGQCPLCDNNAPNLLMHLRDEWETKVNESAGIIKADIAELQKKNGALDKALGQIGDLNKAIERVRERLDGTRRQIGEFLDRELTAKDDPLALLAAELATIDARLEKLEEQVAKRQEELNGVNQQLVLVRAALRVLQNEQKIADIESIQESNEFKQLDSLRDEIATFVDSVACVRSAVTDVLNAEAQEKIAAASRITGEYFRRITDHPSFGDVQLQVESKKATGQNDYKFVNAGGDDITPLLSQGDYNALALSIFLGLGTSLTEGDAFGFFMLDDPSQSMHTTHKERLAGVLDEVARQRNLLISTMDTELNDLLQAQLTCEKTRYDFKSWSPKGGPDIERK